MKETDASGFCAGGVLSRRGCSVCARSGGWQAAATLVRRTPVPRRWQPQVQQISLTQLMSIHSLLLTKCNTTSRL